MFDWSDIWNVAAFVLHLSGAAACTLAAGWIWTKGDRDRPDRSAVIGALGLTAIWSIVAAALGPMSPSTGVVEVFRNLAWVLLLYRLFANDGRHESMRPVRPVVLSLAFVECLQLVLLGIQARFALSPALESVTFEVFAIFRVMVAVGILVLLHNLYVGAVRNMRPLLRWSAAALGAMWAFDLNYFTVAYLSGSVSLELAAIRGLVFTAIAVPLVIGSTHKAASIRLQPSRGVTFRTLSLLIIAAYLVLMIGIARSLAMLGGDLGRLTQVGFIFGASVVALLWIPSSRFRGWVRETTVKHLFRHRYDYRAEWLRFTDTIGQSGDSGRSLQERIIKSMADITDSPSGLLFLVGDTGTVELASRWSWRDIDVPANPIPAQLAEMFEDKALILDIDQVRSNKSQPVQTGSFPDWIQREHAIWAIVPLMHFNRLIGVIFLARPAEPRRLDWEDFDLLRVVGRQLASYLAEQAGEQALMESARFDEFNRRIAFVMHDIKNLTSQLSLLSRNAERHADNAEFRKDMLVTLRNSADKLNSLLARLGRYGTSETEQRTNVNLAAVVQKVVDRYEPVHSVSMIRNERVEVLVDAEMLEQAMVHLVQNAIDASDADSPIYLDINCDGIRGRIEIVDSGTGMTPEFIRDGLFKPFVSSKNAGFGIGAFEAREMIRAMGGRLDVESREGLGTRFGVSFPLSAAAGFLGANNSKYNNDEVA